MFISAEEFNSIQRAKKNAFCKVSCILCILFSRILVVLIWPSWLIGRKEPIIYLFSRLCCFLPWQIRVVLLLLLLLLPRRTTTTTTAAAAAGPATITTAATTTTTILLLDIIIDIINVHRHSEQFACELILVPLYFAKLFPVRIQSV